MITTEKAKIIFSTIDEIPDWGFSPDGSFNHCVPIIKLTEDTAKLIADVRWISSNSEGHKFCYRDYKDGSLTYSSAIESVKSLLVKEGKKPYDKNLVIMFSPLKKSLNLLYVCTANRDRSRTAYEIMQVLYPEHKHDSAGCVPTHVRETQSRYWSKSKILLKEHAEWADKIFIMDNSHEYFISFSTICRDMDTKL